MVAQLTRIPDFRFADFYYFDILKNLLQWVRANVPEITDESDEEPFIQLLRAWALAHHHSNVMLDVVANETLLPSARLLESVRSQLKLIDFRLSQATPAQTEVILKFSSLFTAVSTLIVPRNSQFSTEETEAVDPITFEALVDNSISRTDQLTYVYASKAVAMTLSNKSINLFDYVSTKTPVVGDLLYQDGNYVIVTEVIDGDTFRVNDGNLLDNGAALLISTNFGSNLAGQAITPALTFSFSDTEPQPGDALYLAHDSVMWDRLDIVRTQAFQTGIKGVWEYYDGTTEDANPTTVTNLGSTLRFDLTSLLGTTNREGSVVTLTYVQTSVSEQVVSMWDGTKNIAESTGLLGQVTPSTSQTDYIVGSVWAPLEVTDETNAFSEDGKITYELPQTVTKDWDKTTLSGKEGFWIRFRVQELIKTAATLLGSSFTAAGLNTNNYLVKLRIDAFSTLEVDVTGNLGITPGSYTLAGVVATINAALALLDPSLAAVFTAHTSGVLAFHGPDDSLGKDSLFEIQAPSSKDATLEVFGLSEVGYPKTYIGSGGTPVLDLVKMNGGSQYLLVDVVQGRTTRENPLGSSSGLPEQEFILGHRPLIEGTLLVEVNEGAGFTEYTEVANFLNSDQTSKHYTLEIDANDRATIAFGNGITGKIPPVGIDNIRVTYRIGADVNGNVGQRTININSAGISFVDSVYNPRQATGWAEKQGASPESLAQLKIEGPASIRTLGKAITPSDIEDLASTFLSPSSGSRPVSRARAIEETFGVKTVELVVVGNGGALLNDSQRAELDDYFNGNKVDNVEGVLVTNHEVTTVNYTPRIIDVDVTTIGGNAESIKNAITALLNPEAKFSDNVTYRWNFGDEVPLSVIVAEVQNTDPVSVKKVTINSPVASIQLNSRELPLAGIITVTVV